MSIGNFRLVITLIVGPGDRMPPGKNMDDWYTILRSGMWRLNYMLSREGKKRFFDEFLPMLHDTKHEVMAERDEESWYLVYLGTKPEARGKGYAKRLIEHVTKIVGLSRLIFILTLCCAIEGFKLHF